MSGFGRLRKSDFGLSGLIRYGLHTELHSSDSDDTDYEPGDGLCSISALCSDDSDDMTLNFNGSHKRKKKTEKKKKSGTPKRRKRSLNRSGYQMRGKKSKLDALQVAIKHDEPPGNDTWSILPMEILSHIFSIITKFEYGARYLCRCAQVCHNWSTVVSQSMSWQGTIDLAFLGGEKFDQSSLLHELSNTKFTELRGINLPGWQYLTDRGLKSIAENCYKLEYINISNCQRKTFSNITGKAIKELGERSPLKRVNFSNLRISNQYSSSIIKFLELRSPHLTHLNLSENIAMGSAVLTNICNFCPNLEVLDLSMTSVRSICFETLQRSCTNLKELYLANLFIETKVLKNISDTTENPGFPHLEVLSIALLTRYGPYTNDVLQSILETSGKLNTLDIRGNRNITDDGICIMSNKVERLYMSRMCVGITTVETICTKWSESLWDLDFSWTETVGTQFDLLMNQLCFSCKKIKYLNLAGTPVTDSGVKFVLLWCPDIEYLDLTSCRGISRGYKRLHGSLDAIKALKAFYHV